MAQSQHGGPDEGAQSVARSRRGFSVDASPLNAVKLDLGVILLLGVVLVLVVDRLVPGRLWQIATLAGAGTLGAAWLVWRTRRIVRRQEQGDGA